LDRYVVIGNPVSHSKSPLIHAAFARQTGQELTYQTLLAETDKFAETAEQFFAAGGKGANVTVPFKQEAYALVKNLTVEADTAGAINTLYLNESGALCGHNTDGVGLIRDVTVNCGGKLAGKSILILGAGGATRGILQPFLAQGPASICIANRSVSKAEALVAGFQALAMEHKVGSLLGCGFGELAGQSFDWVFNATSAGLQGDMPPLPDELVTPASWCYDLMYAAQPTPFCQWAQAHGVIHVMDGLGMLVEQAAESFALWRGVRPQTAELLTSLRSG